jgi:hypothetical protein
MTAPISITRPGGLPLTRVDAAIIIFAVPSLLMAAGLAAAHGRPLALLVVPVAAGLVFLRSHPVAAGIAMLIGSTWLRLSYVGIGYSTQVDHARNAAERAFAGQSPYGVLLPSATAPPEPYVYGPLALLWWQPGVVVEFVAAVSVMAILIGTRSWLTLALYAALPFSVYLTLTGVNDYSPGLLIAVGLLVMRRHRIAGALVLSIAAAIKPYAFAWFLPAVGYGGWPVAAAILSSSAALWSPLAIWGPAGFLRSLELAVHMDRNPANALNLPVLRWIAAPLALLGLLVRRWDHMVLIGATIFIAYLFLDRWASLGYWLGVLPIAGIALEQRLSRHWRESS